MWNPVKIEFCNLFSHKHSQYEFKNGKCVVIFGDNKDDKSLQNNGSGKTTLFEAVCIALTNESLRGLKKESFINREADECKIIFCLENSAMKMKLRIERQFFRGSKPAKIAIYENGELNSQIVSVNEANKRVLELIGINREDLLRYFIISQDNHYTFFTASDSEKKEIMNRITSADMVNPVIEQLDLKFKEKDAEYKQINDEIGKLSDKRELLEEQKKEVLANDNTVYEIKRITESKETAEEVIRDKKNDIANYKKRIAELDKELSDIVLTDVTELVKKKKKIQSECDDLESELLNNKKLLKKLKNELGLTITCPHCQKEFIPESQLNLSPEEIREAIGQLNKETSDLSSKLEKREKSLEKVKKDILIAEEQKEEMDNLSYEKNKQQRRINNAQETIKEMQDSIDIYDKQIAELKRKKKDNKLLNSLNERIADCGKQIDELVNRLQPIADEIDMIKFWQFNMGKNGFSTYLANKSIKIIEGITNSFLRKFGVDISVLINGFKILRSGEVREKIDVFVLNDGITAEQFMSKSGGERGRVTLAGILGIQHLINLSTNGRGLNLLLLDEVFPGIDAMGQEKIIKVLETLGVTIMLITQNVSESFNNENTLYVVKSGGESRYV
nr:MAG TPA: STRUCTURAL MAINTENANCE OF CHROMOSOMES PROTEIN [Caudoviricetes sp.]